MDVIITAVKANSAKGQHALRRLLQAEPERSRHQTVAVWRYVCLVGLVAVWLVGLVAMAWTAVNGVSPAPDGHLSGECQPIALDGEASVGQVFTASLPGLYRLQVHLAPTAAHNLTPIVLHLKSDPAAPDVWSGPLRSDLSVEFPPLRNSRGHAYYFSLEVPAAEQQDGLAACYSPGSGLRGGSAYRDGEPLPGNLHFVTFYSLRTRDKAALLAANLAQGRPYMFGTIGLYVGLILMYAALVGLLVVRFTRTLAMAGKERP